MLGGFRCERVNLVEGPKVHGFIERVLKLRMFREELGADDDGARFAVADEADNLVGRDVFFERDHSGARAHDSEIGHAPFRSVLRQKRYPVTVLDAFALQKSSGPQRAFAEISVGIALFAAVSLDAHRDPAFVVLRARVEELDEVLIRIDPFRFGFFVFIEARKDPLPKAR